MTLILLLATGLALLIGLGGCPLTQPATSDDQPADSAVDTPGETTPAGDTATPDGVDAGRPGTDAAVDGCPDDPNKTEPGACGCGVADTDTDGDGTPDCNDGCPADPGKTQPGTCGCGVADTDTDGDGTRDCNDGCPNDGAKTQPGACGCGVADADTDGDGTLDCNDGCPNDPLKTVPGACGCGVLDTDSDRDGTANCVEPVGTLYGITSCCPNQFVRINLTTGGFTVLGNVGDAAMGFSDGVTVDAAGHRYMANVETPPTGWHIRMIDLASGAFTDTPGTSQLTSMAFDAGNRTLYGVKVCCPNQFVHINLNNGVTWIVSDAVATNYSRAAALDPATHRYFGHIRQGGPDTWHIRTFNTETGAFTDSPATAQLLTMGFDWLDGTLVGVTACCPNNFVRIDVATGVATVLNNVSAPGFTGASAIDPVTHRFFVCVDVGAGDHRIRQIDTRTGAYVDSPTIPKSVLSLGVD